MVDVPFRRRHKDRTAILGGHVPAALLRSPRSRRCSTQTAEIFALLLEKRADFAPTVPTVVELGYNFPGGSYWAFSRQTIPDDIVKKLNDVTAKIANGPGVPGEDP